MWDGDPGAVIRALIERLDNPLAYFISGGQRVYWLYFFWAILIALVFFVRAAQGKVSLWTFLRFAFPASVYWSRSARVDYGWFLFCRPIFVLLLLPPMLLLAPALSVAFQSGLRASVPGLQDTITSSTLLVGLYTVVAILVSDFAGFLTHSLQHRIPLLWEFHKIHHSAEKLTPMTVYRMHPVDDLLLMVIAGVFLAATTAFFQFVAIGPLSMISAFGVNIFFVAFLLFGANLRHSHLWIDYGPSISRWLISPAQHQIHHSDDPRHRDRNMGLLFAFWDRLFGTLFVPDGREEIRFGLAGGEEREYSNPVKLFWLPFHKLIGRRGWLAASSGGLIAVGLVGLSFASTTVMLSEPQSYGVHLEDLTWLEVDGMIKGGKRTVLVPTAGHEQNGPHVVLGKHHHVVRFASERIARELGDTLVAPVVTYVPEGGIEPREGHMRFPGTISVPTETFESILEYTARSLRAHGFEKICFVGDSGDNQDSQARVARRLNAEWKDEPTRVIHVDAYYASNGQMEWLIEQGIPKEEVGRHAGVRDTSEILYVHPEGARPDRFFESAHDGMRGVNGDPTRASAEIGRKMIELKVSAAVEQIRAAGDAAADRAASR